MRINLMFPLDLIMCIGQKFNVMDFSFGSSFIIGSDKTEVVKSFGVRIIEVQIMRRHCTTVARYANRITRHRNRVACLRNCMER